MRLHHWLQGLGVYEPVSKLARKIILFVAESLGKTLLESAGTKVGEGIGNRIARKIDPAGKYPPDPESDEDDEKSAPKVEEPKP